MSNSVVIISVCPEIYKDFTIIEDIKSVILVSLEIFFTKQGFSGIALENVLRIKLKIRLDTTLPDGDSKVKAILVFARYLDISFPDEFMETIESRLLSIGIGTKVSTAKREDLKKLKAFK